MRRDFLSARARAFESSGIRKIFDLSANRKDIINFSIGQPDFPPGDMVLAATAEAARSGKSGYTPTQGIPELREKVSQKLLKENDINVSVEQILVTPGISAGVFLSLATIIDPEDEIIIPDPCFVEYPTLVRFLGGIPVSLDTYPDFQIDTTKLTTLINKKTKAILLNSPNNPSGAVYDEGTLREIARVAAQHELLIISDEIYEKFVYEIPHFSVGSIYEDTVTLQGLSKSGGMPGWRLGWAAGPATVIDKMKELQQYTFVCAPTLVQYGALESFSEDLSEKISGYKERRDLMYNILSRKFPITKPSGAFYVMAEVGNGDNFAKWALEQNILVVPGNCFSARNSHVRLSYATSLEQIEKGTTRLLEYPL